MHFKIYKVHTIFIINAFNCYTLKSWQIAHLLVKYNRINVRRCYMQNNNRKMLENLVSRTKIYLAIILILLIILSVQNIKYIIPSIIVYAAIVGYT